MLLCFVRAEWIAQVGGDWSHSVGQQMASVTQRKMHNVSYCHSDHLFWMGRHTQPTMLWFSPLRPCVWNGQNSSAASMFRLLQSHSFWSITSHRLLVLIIMKQPPVSLLHLKVAVPRFIDALPCEWKLSRRHSVLTPGLKVTDEFLSQTPNRCKNLPKTYILIDFIEFNNLCPIIVRMPLDRHPVSCIKIQLNLSVFLPLTL